MAIFTVPEARTSSEAVVGVGARITVEHFEEKAFLWEGEWFTGMDPYLEVTGRGFNHHATGLPGVIRELVVTFYGCPIEVVHQKIMRWVQGLHEDMSAFGIMCLEVRYFVDMGIDPPESFLEIEHGQLPVSVEKAVQFFKDGFHDHPGSIRCGDV